MSNRCLREWVGLLVWVVFGMLLVGVFFVPEGQKNVLLACIFVFFFQCVVYSANIESKKELTSTIGEAALWCAGIAIYYALQDIKSLGSIEEIWDAFSKALAFSMAVVLSAICVAAYVRRVEARCPYHGESKPEHSDSSDSS